MERESTAIKAKWALSCFHDMHREMALSIDPIRVRLWQAFAGNVWETGIRAWLSPASAEALDRVCVEYLGKTLNSLCYDEIMDAGERVDESRSVQAFHHIEEIVLPLQTEANS